MIPRNSEEGDPPDTDEEREAFRPTRSEQTRAAAAVNRLGVDLTKLSPAELDSLELPDRVRDAIAVSQRLKPRDRGRQNRLIGQLLRAEDHEAIRVRFEALSSQHRAGVQHEKRNEAWRDRLLEEGDDGVEALIALHPEADRQRLRLLVRNARRESGSKSTKRARLELLRTLREIRAR